MKILEAFGSILGKFIAFSEIDQERAKQQKPQHQHDTSEVIATEVDDFESEEMFNEFFNE